MMHALCKGDNPLPHGLAVQNKYIKMVTGSKSVVVMVRNLTVTPITLKKNTPVVRVVAANAVPIAQIQLGMVVQLITAQGILIGRPKMTVEWQREVLFKQLDLSGHGFWTPQIRVAAQSLLAEYQNIFSLDSCELGGMDQAWHIIKVTDDEELQKVYLARGCSI